MNRQAFDPRYPRRLALALVLALVIHAVLLLLAPHQASPPPPRERHVIRVVTIERRRPTPRPLAVSPSRKRAQAPHHSAGSSGRKAPHARIVQPRPRPIVAALRTLPPSAPPIHASPEQHSSLLASPAAPALPSSVATRTGETEGHAATGSGDTAAGTGPGAGGAGSGSGGGGSDNGSGGGTPCGLVMLIGLEAFNWNDGAHYRHIRLSVHLSNGEIVTDDLHWAFFYPSEAADPFSKVHVNDSDFPTLLQRPPEGFNLESEQNPATVFAVQHTNANGYTDLHLCPGQSPPPKL